MTKLNLIPLFLIAFLSVFQASALARVECTSEISVINNIVQEKLGQKSVVGLWEVEEHGLKVIIPDGNRLVATVEQTKDGEVTTHKNLRAQACRTERGIKVTLSMLFFSSSFEIYLDGGVLKFKELSGKKRSGVITKS